MNDAERLARKRAANARHRAKTRELCAERSRRWRAANPGRNAEMSRRWYIENQERERESARSRYWKDPEKHRESARQRRVKNPEATRIAFAKWYSKNRHKVRALEARRRARERGAGGKASSEQIVARWEFFGGNCWMCGCPADSLDHVIPLARGGTNWPANLRPACRSCNSSKRDRKPGELRVT